MADIVFLKALREKLKGGNSKSIHLNALPGRFATRLDFADLNYINPTISNVFLETLFGKSNFEFKISFDDIDFNSISNEEQKKFGLLSKRLNSITIENDDNFKEHGIKTFGFGYPILIKPSKQDPKKIIKAPLFIWQLEIVKSTNKVNTWSILRNKIKTESGRIVDQDLHSVELNEVLLSFLKTDCDISIAQFNEELLEDEVISKEELMDECVRVLKSINGSASSVSKDSLFAKFNSQQQSIPDSNSLDSISSNNSWIYFGGVFGLYRTQKESIITDIDEIIANYNNFTFEELKSEKHNLNPLSAIETDPSQQEILATLHLHPKKIIQGPPGTGKSQSLTALITNALANNLKCLVVCEKKTALEVIKNNLNKESAQLSELAALIEDIASDRDAIVHSVRGRISNERSPNFNDNTYESIILAIQNNICQINNEHKQLDNKIFLGRNWTDLVGAFLKKHKLDEFLLLKNKLDYKQFSFAKDDNELRDIVSKIKSARKLFQEIKNLNHPLSVLNDKVFSEDNPRGIQLKIEDLVESLYTNISSLSNLFDEQIEEYGRWLKLHYSNLLNEINITSNDLHVDIEDYKTNLDNHYLNYYSLLKEKINSYKTFASENNSLYGEVFFKNDGFSKIKINILSTISKRHRNIKKNRFTLLQDIEEIKKLHQSQSYFDHSYIDGKELKNLGYLVDDIKNLERNLENWNLSVKTTISGYIKNFTSSNLHPCYSLKQSSIKKTEDKFNSIDELIKIDDKLNIQKEEKQNHLSKFTYLNFVHTKFDDQEQLIDYYKINLSSSSLHPYYTNEAARSIETSYEQLLVNLNNENFLSRHLKNVATHPQKKSELEEISDDLNKIKNNLSEFRDYYNWMNFFLELTPANQTIIRILIESGADNWESAFESWYYFWLLSTNEHKDLPTNDEKIQELYEYKKQLNPLQVKSIVANWKQKQDDTIRETQTRGINIVSLYNKRGVRGERRNSIRKIVKSDFNLFTAFYPVVMVSPTVCSSILPLKENIFDLVIFDEASQLRLEDTFPALMRGNIKIISGDSHQMPPSNFFQGGNAILNPLEEELEDEEMQAEELVQNKDRNASLVLAESESLLVYAENCNYKQSYLHVHYRSQHPHLIEFSNHAFYGKKLIPMPAKNNYKPIHYIQVDGVYEDSVNRDEARQVVDILLHHIKPFSNGKYPSVGVGTFNLYQRNIILEEIIKARQLKPEYDKKIGDLGSDLFVKNLENIQGDERDIIILSTTFGKRSDGTFRQQFGPILQRNGYKLLNVIVTRAKYKLYVCTSIPSENINQYSNLLNQFKNNGRAAFYSYLAYAKYVSEGNDEAREQLLGQLYENCESRNSEHNSDSFGSESPFEEEVYIRLSKKIGQDRVIQQYKIGGFRIDMVVKSKVTGNPIIAIECDGAKYHSSNEAYAWDMFREKTIKPYGFTFHRIWSTNWWYSQEKELKKLLDFIAKIDLEERIAKDEPMEDLLKEEAIVPINSRPETKNKVEYASAVTLKNPEGKIIKVKFSKTQNLNANKIDKNGILSIYEQSPLALAIMGRTEGEACQLGMLELYYQIIKIEQ